MALQFSRSVFAILVVRNPVEASPHLVQDLLVFFLLKALRDVFETVTAQYVYGWTVQFCVRRL